MCSVYPVRDKQRHRAQRRSQRKGDAVECPGQVHGVVEHDNVQRPQQAQTQLPPVCIVRKGDARRLLRA